MVSSNLFLDFDKIILDILDLHFLILVVEESLHFFKPNQEVWWYTAYLLARVHWGMSFRQKSDGSVLIIWETKAELSRSKLKSELVWHVFDFTPDFEFFV